MTKFETELMMEDLTKYINRRLRHHDLVRDWGFSMTFDGKYGLIVRIDYIGNFHSRDIIIVEDGYELKDLQMAFDFYFGRHLDELHERNRRLKEINR